VLFQALWNELVSLVSTPATAALVRRGIKRASAREAQADWPVVLRQGLEYSFTTPAPWQDPARRDAVEQLQRLVREDLDPLFHELTGPVIARRLAQVPELVLAGLASEEDR
jgi:hypothetical protein